MSCYINNDSFNSNFKCYHEENYVGQFIDCREEENKIVLTTNFMSAPRIVFSKKDNLFMFDLGNENIKIFLEENFTDPYKSIDELSKPYSLFTQTVKKDYLFNHVEYIENWSKVIIYPDGSFETEEYPLVPYSIELKDGFEIVYNWIRKYKIAVNKLVDENKFTPIITGGIDTRTFTFLYRNKVDKIDAFHIKPIKNDGKNHVDLGAADLKCAFKVANTIGIKNQIENIPHGNVTVTGKYSESNRGMFELEPNNPLFIFKIMQHHILKSGISKYLIPLADDDFLIIKQPGKNVCRCLLALLLCPDLLDLPCIGTQRTFEKYNYNPYNFYEEYKDVIEEAKKIIEYWGKDNCSKLKNLMVLE